MIIGIWELNKRFSGIGLAVGVALSQGKCRRCFSPHRTHKTPLRPGVRETSTRLLAAHCLPVWPGQHPWRKATLANTPPWYVQPSLTAA
jgi:hypothetical protein